jgi:ABC-type transport system involved in multi-copper enzyme maturation permease subunit
MVSLIAREIRDNIVSVALPCLVSALGITLAIVFAFSRVRGGVLPPTTLVIPILLLAFCGLGASQAYGDRANRISSLLATLGVTRNRIFAARVLAGLLTVLVSLVPLAVTTILLLWMFAPPLEFYGRMVVEISLTVLLAAVACYCAGLLVGWTTSKAWLLAGCVLLLLSLVSLVVIKGFGPDAMALLLLFSGATLWYSWHAFTSTSL